MKFKKYLFIVLFFLISASTAHAGWGETKIRHLQMPSTGNVVYVYLTEPVPFDNCTNATVQQFLLRKPSAGASNNFEEIYALILAASMNDSTIEVLSSSGDCFNGVWIDGPYIRLPRT